MQPVACRDAGDRCDQTKHPAACRVGDFMTPKQMIEGQIAEFEMLAQNAKVSAEVWNRSSIEWAVKNPRVAEGQFQTSIAADTQYETLTLCANRLRELLKLKGWE